jgi:hypothetical protein
VIARPRLSSAASSWRRARELRWRRSLMNAEANAISNAIAAEVGETPLQATPAKVCRNVTWHALRPIYSRLRRTFARIQNCVRLRGSSSSVLEHQIQTRTPLQFNSRSHDTVIRVYDAGLPSRRSARAMQDGVGLALLHFLQQLTDFQCGRRNDLDTAPFRLR